MPSNQGCVDPRRDTFFHPPSSLTRTSLPVNANLQEAGLVVTI